MIITFPRSRIVSEKNAKRSSTSVRWILDQHFTVAEIAPWFVTLGLAVWCLAMVMR